MRYRYLIILFLGIYTISGCSSEILQKGQKEYRNSGLDSRNELFDTQVPILRMNRGLQLQLVDVDNDPQFSIVIDTLLLNYSDEVIWFPPDFGSQIYMFDENNGGWKKVDDQMVRMSKKEIIYPPLNNQNGLIGAKIFSVSPVISRENYPVLLRILVIGNVYKDGVPTDEQMGAYLDVVLEP